MWTTCLVLARRSIGAPSCVRRSIIGLRSQIYVLGFSLLHCHGAKNGPSHKNKWPNVASQIRVAFASIALKTECKIAART